MNSVLVTGAGGFLGRYVCRHFTDDGWHVLGVGAADPDQSVLAAVDRYVRLRLPHDRLGELLSEVQPTVCVHCAGMASVPRSVQDPIGDFRAGPPVVVELLNQLRLHSPHTRFIFLSSAAVYGNPCVLPIGEQQPPAPISPYGYHKLMGEQLCAEFSSIYDIWTASLRIFSAYGEGLRRQVWWDICTKVSQQPVVTLHGTGEESRDFIHAADVARAVSMVARSSGHGGAVYNVATGTETTIAAAAGRIRELLAPRCEIRFDGCLPPGTPRNWRADTRKLEALGFRPKVALDEGAARFVRWFHREGDAWQKQSA